MAPADKRGAKVGKPDVFSCIRFAQKGCGSHVNRVGENNAKNIWLKTVAGLSLPSLKTE